MRNVLTFAAAGALLALASAGCAKSAENTHAPGGAPKISTPGPDAGAAYLKAQRPDPDDPKAKK